MHIFMERNEDIGFQNLSKLLREFKDVRVPISYDQCEIKLFPEKQHCRSSARIQMQLRIFQREIK